MKDRQPTVRPGVNVGFISLLMIFMVLCLTVFIALSLLSAGVDKRLTDRTGETVLAYYEAWDHLQSFLSELDALLLEWRSGLPQAAAIATVVGSADVGGETFMDLLRERLAAQPEELVWNGESQVISVQWPAGERLIFRADVLIDSSTLSSRYTMQSVMMVPVRERMDKPMDNLWKGEDFFQ